MTDPAPTTPDKPEDELLEMSREELERRVIYTMFTPALKLARRFKLPLKDLGYWLETAYYHELKRAGLRGAQAAEHLGVSHRKVITLSRQLKEAFMAVELNASLPRRIEFLLWAGPHTEGRIIQLFEDHEEAHVHQALATLVEQERVVREDKRPPEYRVLKRNFRLFQDQWVARLDGLQNLLASMERVISARFFDEDERAFARTLSFRLRPEDMSELQRFYEEQLWPYITELEARVEADDEVQLMDLSIFWGPHQE
jgi:hypothetical protein